MTAFESLPNVARLVATPALHPDTEPEAIAAAQRGAVREAAEALRARGVAPTPQTLSAEAVLPVSVVLRRLGEIEKAKIAS